MALSLITKGLKFDTRVMLLILKSSNTGSNNHSIAVKELTDLKHNYNVEAAKYVLVDVSWKRVLDCDHNNQTFDAVREFLLKR